MLYIPYSLKRCTKCGEWKLDSRKCFHLNGARLYSMCGTCKCAKETQYQKANKAIIAERKRQFYQTNKERILERNMRRYLSNREYALEQKRRYYQKDKQRHNERVKQYHAANKERIKESQQQWRQRNNGYLVEYRKKYSKTAHGKLMSRKQKAIRRARKVASPGNLTIKGIRRQYDAQQGRCYYCKAELSDKYHVDHFIPLSRGGTNTLDNIVIACPTCNMRKHNKMPDEFLALLRAEKEMETTMPLKPLSADARHKLWEIAERRCQSPLEAPLCQGKPEIKISKAIIKSYRPVKDEFKVLCPMCAALYAGGHEFEHVRSRLMREGELPDNWRDLVWE